MVTNYGHMTRNISKRMAPVLERLERERPELVTASHLASILEEANIKSPAKVVAARLRDRGWLLETGERGVWEFAPAEVAGPYSSFDPLLPFASMKAAHPEAECALTMQTAAWALGAADRVPARIEVAFADGIPTWKTPSGIRALSFRSNLPFATAKGTPCLAPEAIAVHMAAKPSAVRSWSSALEWLPDVTYEMNADRAVEELEGRPASVAARTGYLLQGMRPDIAEAIRKAYPPSAKNRFGPRGAAMRNDERWKISDTLLPFDPAELEDAK